MKSNKQMSEKKKHSSYKTLISQIQEYHLFCYLLRSCLADSFFFSHHKAMFNQSSARHTQYAQILAYSDQLSCYKSHIIQENAHGVAGRQAPASRLDFPHGLATHIPGRAVAAIILSVGSGNSFFHKINVLKYLYSPCIYFHFKLQQRELRAAQSGMVQERQEKAHLSYCCYKLLP